MARQEEEVWFQHLPSRTQRTFSGAAGKKLGLTPYTGVKKAALRILCERKGSPQLKSARKCQFLMYLLLSEGAAVQPGVS